MPNLKNSEKLAQFREKMRQVALYIEWRKAVFKRDDYTCQHCQQRSRAFLAHHIRSWSKYPELRYEVDNGLTLCKSCHDIANREQRIAEQNSENEGKEDAC